MNIRNISDINGTLHEQKANGTPWTLELRVEKTLDSLPFNVLLLDQDHRIVWANKTVSQILGLQTADIVGNQCFKIVHGREKVLDNCPMEEAIRLGRPVECELTDEESGRLTHSAVYPTKLMTGNGQKVYLHATRDITERRIDVDQACEGETILQKLCAGAPLIVREEDFSRVKSYMDVLRNKGVSDLFSYFKEHPEVVAHCASMVEVLNVNKPNLASDKKNDHDLFMVDLGSFISRDSYGTFWEELVAISEGQERFEGETSTLSLTGEQRDILVKWAALDGYEKTYARVLVSIIDITGIKQAQRSLTLEHRHMLSLFDRVTDRVYFSDPETDEILYINNVLRERFGDVVGQKCYRAFQGKEAPCEACTNPEIFDKNLYMPVVRELKNPLDGRWYRCVSKAVRWPDGRLVRFATATDITDEK